MKIFGRFDFPQMGKRIFRRYLLCKEEHRAENTQYNQPEKGKYTTIESSVS